MRHSVRRLTGLLLTGATFALLGCTAITAITDATRYYVLSPSPETSGTSRTALSSAGIGVGPIVIPGYLDRLQIVTRGANDEIEISTYHRWAEPLDSGIAETLADDLAAQIGNERIAVFPWRGGVARVLDYQVTVVVLRRLTRPPGDPRRTVAPARQGRARAGAEALHDQRACYRRGLRAPSPRNEPSDRRPGTRDRLGDAVTRPRAGGGVFVEASSPRIYLPRVPACFPAADDEGDYAV
jgi:uncharacterized lipoprotein YmbA